MANANHIMQGARVVNGKALFQYFSSIKYSEVSYYGEMAGSIHLSLRGIETLELALHDLPCFLTEPIMSGAPPLVFT